MQTSHSLAIILVKHRRNSSSSDWISDSDQIVSESTVWETKKVFTLGLLCGLITTILYFTTQPPGEYATLLCLWTKKYMLYWCIVSKHFKFYFSVMQYLNYLVIFLFLMERMHGYIFDYPQSLTPSTSMTFLGVNRVMDGNNTWSFIPNSP